MRLAVIVTEYPKTTETFILRDVMMFLAAGVDLRLYHLTSFRRAEILHDFAAPTRALARHVGLVSGAGLGAAARRPGKTTAHAARIICEQWAEPLLMAKSLALLPQASVIADELASWGADHIHAEFAGHPATAAWIIHHRTGIPYSVSCRAHDIFRSQRLLAQKLGDAAVVRTVSNYARAFLLERVRGLDPDKVTVVHSSIDIASIPFLDPPPRDPFHVVYVGALQVRKGVDVLLRALAGLDIPGWHCTLAGDGPERARLEALAAELGIASRVRFLGKQGFEQITRLYREASVVLAPSVIGPKGRTEGIPNVMIEALAFRRPAISTNVSGIPELIINGVTGLLVAPGSVDALRKAILAVHAEPDAAWAMACAGRRHVENEFDLRRNAARQLALFDAHPATALRRKE